VKRYFDKFITHRRNSLTKAIKELFSARIEDNIGTQINSLLLFKTNALIPYKIEEETNDINEINLIKVSQLLPKHLNQNELANRLGFHPDTIARKRLNKNFTEWTKEHDVNGIGWVYSEETGSIPNV
jgi:hypothetical protein